MRRFKEFSIMNYSHYKFVPKSNIKSAFWTRIRKFNIRNCRPCIFVDRYHGNSDNGFCEAISAERFILESKKSLITPSKMCSWKVIHTIWCVNDCGVCESIQHIPKIKMSITTYQTTTVTHHLGCKKIERSKT